MFAAKPASVPLPGLFDPFSFIVLEFGLIVIIALGAHALAHRWRVPVALTEIILGMLTANGLSWLDWSPVFFLIMHLGDAGRLFWEVWASGSSIAEAAVRIFPPTTLVPGETGARLVGSLTGPAAPEFLLMGIALWLFSNLGSIFLLFKTGLESDIDSMLRGGPAALRVSVAGLMVTVMFSLSAGYLFFPGASLITYSFIGIALATSSVRLAIAQLDTFGLKPTREGIVILGAAFLADVLALSLTAILVSSAITGRSDPLEVGKTTLLAVLFMAATIFISQKSRNWTLWRAKVGAVSRQTLLVLSIALASILSWLASMAHLSVILGAFAAGLILSGHVRTRFTSESSGFSTFFEPLEAIFAPVFFVLMGMQVDLQHFLSLTVVGLALVLSIIAVVGKGLAGFAVNREVDRLTVGIVLIPRAETGLVIAGLGKALGVIDDTLFSALIMTILLSMLIPPILLHRWRPHLSAKA